MQVKEDVYIYKTPEKLLQKLISFNTTNPPGNERDCILYIKNLFDMAGIENRLIYKDEKRLNLYVRVKGRGEKPPLLMYGHADVVTVKGQNWRVDPFEGVIEDGFVWGRGALDMKGPLTMMICALLRISMEKITPPGDIILLILSDEEEDGIYGAKFIVDEYKDLLKDVKYAIGEIGGFSMHLAGKKFYPIMISEKQFCHIRLKIQGLGGHASVPQKNSAMAKASEIIMQLNKKSFPIHITPPVRLMIESLADNLNFPFKIVLKSLLNPYLSNTLMRIAGSSLDYFNVLLRNTVNPTIINGGHKINVIPSEIKIDLDCRILPGQSAYYFIEELKGIIGDVEYEIITYDEGPTKVDMGLFKTLTNVLTSMDDGIPIPFVIGGVTDARFFSKLNIQTYGFTPMRLPKGFDFSSLIHNEDERIPIEALHFGCEAISKLLLIF